MISSVLNRSVFRRASSRWLATGGMVAALAATTLTACGPRDETPLAGGSAAAPLSAPTAPAVAPTGMPVDPARVGNPVPAQQMPAAVTAPAPAYAPPPVVVAQAPAQAPAYAPVPPNGYAAPPQYVPVPAGNPTVVAQNRPIQVQPAPRTAAPVVPRNRVGSITGIEPIRTRPKGSGAGAVIGGVLGGVLGNQFGHGLGRAAMTGAGVAGGAIAGNNVERNYKEGVAGYRVHVRLDNGYTRTFQRRNIGNLHVGDRVLLDANGFRRA
jgi:outer membrane lipoprotein SlyB